MVTELPASGMASGMLGTGASNVRASTCTGDRRPGRRGGLRLPGRRAEHPAGDHQHRDHHGRHRPLRPPRVCQNTSTELACNDDISATVNKSSLTVELQPGSYYLVVDAQERRPDRRLHGPGDVFKGRASRAAARRSARPATSAACWPAAPAPPASARCAATAATMTATSRSTSPTIRAAPRPTDADRDRRLPERPRLPGLRRPRRQRPGRPDRLPGGHRLRVGQRHHRVRLRVDRFRCGPFTTNLTGQMTATLHDDIDLSCGINGKDEVYALNITRPLAELYVDTIGSTINTAVGLKKASCSSRSGVRRRRRRQRRLADFPDRRRGRRVLHRRRRRQPRRLLQPPRARRARQRRHLRPGAPTAVHLRDRLRLQAARGAAYVRRRRATTGDDDGAGDGNGYPNDPGCVVAQRHHRGRRLPGRPELPAVQQPHRRRRRRR